MRFLSFKITVIILWCVDMWNRDFTVQKRLSDETRHWYCMVATFFLSLCIGLMHTHKNEKQGPDEVSIEYVRLHEYIYCFGLSNFKLATSLSYLSSLQLIRLITDILQRCVYVTELAWTRVGKILGHLNTSETMAFCQSWL